MSSALLEKELNNAAFGGEDDMRQYLSDIRAFPRLTQEAERELARRCAQGDAEAIRLMQQVCIRNPMMLQISC